MADLTSLLASYGVSPSQAVRDVPAADPAGDYSVVDSKIAAVNTASARKQAAMGVPSVGLGAVVAASNRVGYGQATASPLERDMATLSPREITEKYGYEKGARILSAKALGSQLDLSQRTAVRSGGDVLGDTAVGVGLGLGNLAAGLTALGVLPISPKASMVVSSAADSATQWAQKNLQSDVLNAQRNLYASEQYLAHQDNIKRQADDIAAGKDKFTAGMARIGRDALAAADNTLQHGAVLGDISANALGSMLAFGPISGAIEGAAGKAGSLIATHVGKGLGRGLLQDVGLTATRMADRHSAVIANALMEGGGALQGSLAQLDKTSMYDAADKNPEIKAMLDAGMDPADIKASLAGRVGWTSAVPAAILGGIAGPISASVERAPFKFGSLGHTVVGAAKEGLEEGLQGLTGQLSQNLATKMHVDSSQDMLEGVGEQIGQGVIGGIGSVGITQSPSIAARSLVLAGKSSLKGAGMAASLIGKAAGMGAEAQSAANEQAAAAPSIEAAKAAPAAAAAAETAIQSVVEQQGDSLTPEEKSHLADLTESVQNMRNVGPDALAAMTSQLHISDKLKAALGGNDNLPSYLRTAVSLLGAPESVTSKDEKHALLTMVAQVVEPMDRALNSNQKVTEYLVRNGDPETRYALRKFGEVVKTLRNSPDFIAAQNAIRKVAADAAAEPTQEQAPETVLAMASLLRPDQIPAEWVEQIQRAHSSGQLQLTAAQKGHLQTVRSLLQARRDFAAQVEANGQTAPSHDVTTSMSVGSAESSEGNGKHSLATFANKIYQAYKSGDKATAKLYLEHLQMFAQHMQNKLGVMNQHMQDGTFGKENGKPFQLLHPTSKRWVESFEKPWLDLTKPGSVKTAQDIHNDTHMVTQVAQSLAKAYPDLGVKPIGDSVGLDSRLLNAHPREIVQRFSQQPWQSQTAPTPVQQTAASAEKAAPAQQTAVEQKSQEASPKQAEPVQEAAPVEAKQDQAKPQEVKETPVKHSTQQVSDLTTPAEAVPAKAAEAVAESKPAAEKAEEPTPDESKTEPAPVKEAAPEPASQQEEALAPEQDHAPDPTEEHQEVAEEDAKPQTLAERFPKLIGVYDKAAGRLRNWFVTSFKNKAESTLLSRVSDAPMALMHALHSDERMAALWGRPLNVPFNDRVSKAYRHLVGEGVPFMRNALQKNLDSFLDATPKGKGEGKSLRSRLEAGDTPMHTWANGKALNIVEKGADGEYRYNPQLLDGAILAGLQWFLQSNDSGGKVDAEDVSDILGIREETAEGLVGLFQGLSDREAVTSLASKISQYWGVHAEKDAPLGFAEGIPYAVAGEVLRVLNDAHLLSHVNMEFSSEGRLLQTTTDGEITYSSPLVSGEKTGKQANRVIPKAISELEKAERFTGLGESRNVIDAAMLREPDQQFFFDKDLPPVAATQMHNPVVKNSPDQRRAIENAQATEYKLNVPVLDLYRALGENVLKQFFGGGDYLQEDAKKRFNKVDLLSRDGRNVQLVRALEQIETIRSESQARADADGKSLKDVVMHFAFNFSKVGRMQMLGLFNPQSSKLMREVLLPTRSSIDVSSSSASGANAMMLALGQAFGVKIHRFDQLSVNEQTQTILDKLDDNGASETIHNWLDTQQKGDPQPLGKTEVAAIFDGLRDAGAPVSEVALHALVDYVRMQRARVEGTAKDFETHLYVEADGVSNGPANALSLLTPGAFTLDNLRNMRKCGVAFAGKDGDTPVAYSLDRLISGVPQVDELNEGSNRDLYGSSGDNLQDRLLGAPAWFAKRAYPGAQHKLEAHYKKLLWLLNEFVGDVSVAATDDGLKVTIARGVMKNPLTVTIYGSGNNGIANKLTSTLMEEIYSRMSLAAEERYQLAADGRDLGSSFDPAVALFGKTKNGEERSPEDAAQRLAVFQRAMHDLTNMVMATNWKDRSNPRSWLADATGPDGKKLPVQAVPDVRNPTDFALSPLATQTLQNNLFSLFVDPFLAPSVRDTVGSTMDAARQIQTAVAVQSIFLREHFAAAVKEALQSKAEASDDPKGIKQEFLSRNELDGIMDKLKQLSPLVRTGSQDFYIAARQSSPLFGEKLTFGRALNDEFATAAQVSVPDNAGVKAIATINIGTGDGQMVLSIYSKNQNPQSLPVFDGINGRLTHIEHDGLVANKAAAEAMFQNPSQYVLDSYSAFLKMGDLSDSYSAETRDELAKTLNLPKKLRGDWNAIVYTMHGLELTLADQARSVEARHEVLKKLHMSFDQMAAGKAPYLQKGELFWNDLGSTDQERLGALNGMYQEKLTSLEEADKRRTDRLDTRVLTEAGAEKLEGANVFRLVGKELGDFLFKNQGILNKSTQAVVNALAYGSRIRNMQVLIGSPEELSKVAQRFNLSSDMLADAQNKGTQGLMLPDRNLLLMFNSDVKTLAHEMVHAATYSVMQAYYDGKLEGAEHTHVREAMVRLEALRDQFYEEGLQMVGVSAEVHQQFDTMLQAVEGAMNKYGSAAGMNEFLAYALSMDKLIQMGKNMKANKISRIVSAIRTALRKLLGNLPTVKDDVFSNLVFNAAVLSKSIIPPSATQEIADATHLEMRGYGLDARLQTIDEHLNEALFRHLEDPSRSLSRDQALNREANDRLPAEAAEVIAASKVESAFNLTPQATNTFRNIVNVMATSMELATPSVSRMQDLFTHFMESFSWQDFLKDPKDTSDQQEVYDAQNMYNTLIGEHGYATDAYGRSTLLPTFVGLAMVDENFRAKLEGVKLPGKTLFKNPNDTFDDAVRNGANRIIEEMNSVLTGEQRNQPNVRTALDALMENVLKQSQDKKSWFDQLSNTTGPHADAINQAVSSCLEKFGAWVGEASEDLSGKAKNPVVKAVATIGQITGSLFNEEVGARGAEAILKMMNRWQADMPTIKRLMADLVGRVGSNASIYDRIKGVNAIISQDRQRFREHLPSEIAKQFKEMPSEEQWSALSRGLAQSDLACLIKQGMSSSDAIALLSDQSKLAGHIATAEQEIQRLDPKRSKLIISKSEQLAEFMQTGTVGRNLLRNAEAIAYLLGEKGALRVGRSDPANGLVPAIDKLVTLRSLDKMSKTDKVMLAELTAKEAVGMSYSLDYLYGLSETERSKPAHPNVRFNAFKGYVPSEQDNNATLIVAHNAERASLLSRSFVHLGNYGGSDLDRTPDSLGYYYAPVSGKAPLNQGIIQNVRPSFSGVDAMNGATTSMPLAGRITDPVQVAEIAKRIGTEQGTSEPLLATYDAYGEPIAYERTLDPAMLARIGRDTHLASQIGVWRGRQVEESKAAAMNQSTIDDLHEMYRDALRESSSNEKEFIDVLDPAELKKDPVLADVVRVLPLQLKFYASTAFGMRADGNPRFMVRRDLVDDVLGYRKASVGDMWTGNTRWSPAVQSAIKDVLTSFMGNKAYAYAVNAEQTWQSFVKDSRTLVIVKSVVVPLSNMYSNAIQLVSLGVPLKTLRKGVTQKLAEIEFYNKGILRHMSLEARLNTVRGDMIAERRINTEMKSIEDSFRRLSIWPLITAGEFTAISDAGISRDDILLSSGRVHAYIEKLVDKLPQSLQTIGKYATISKDTALFQGLQKAVDYGDFVAKAVYYDDLVGRKKMSSKAALAEVTEEFINYDRLAGRVRGYLEASGMAWYFNYKIRSAKVALRMIQRNPFHAAVGFMVPAPAFLGSVGSPLENNVFSKLFDGQLFNAFGPGQALRSFKMNPYVNLIM